MKRPCKSGSFDAQDFGVNKRNAMQPAPGPKVGLARPMSPTRGAGEAGDPQLAHHVVVDQQWRGQCCITYSCPF